MNEFMGLQLYSVNYPRSIVWQLLNLHLTNTYLSVKAMMRDLSKLQEIMEKNKQKMKDALANFKVKK